MTAATLESCLRASEATATIDDCFIQLLDEYERPLYNFLLVVLRDADAARDCTQDTYLRAYEHLGHGKPVNRSWLYTVARNRAIDLFRKRKWTEPGSDPLVSISASSGHERGVEIREALRALPARDRHIIYLHDVAGFNGREIAGILGVRATTARQRLFRARERLRAAYLA